MRRGCDSRFAAQQRRKARAVQAKVLSKAVPSPRLVGVEPNPGPPNNRNRGKAIAKRPRPANRPRRRKAKASPAGPNPMRVRRGTGKLGLSSNPSSGVTTRFRQVIEEDEYIADVNGSSGFATTAYSINPGNSTTFPWGSRIAQLYDKYDFQMLEFYYKRIASEFNTSASTGNVILSIDYNASDPAPTTLQQVLSTLTKNVGMPCDEFIPLRLDCAVVRDSPAKYVLTGAQPANTDAKTYNAGTLYVTTQGTGTSNTLGRLYVRYRCLLKEPILEPATVAGGVIHLSSIAPVSANNLAGMTLQSGGTPTMTGITAAGNTVTFPAGIPGTYLLVFQGTAATSWASVSFASATGGVGLVSLFVASTPARDSQGSAYSLASTSGAFTTVTLAVTLTAAAGTLVLTPGTVVGNAAADLFVISLPTALITSKAREPASLLERLARLERMLVEQDEEKEDYQCPSSSSSDMSQSLLGIVGEYVARKSTSQKK